MYWTLSATLESPFTCLMAIFFRPTVPSKELYLMVSPSEIINQVLQVRLLICPLLGNDKVRALAEYLKARKFNVKPILSPTVPKGTERVRICLHGDNTVEQIDALADAVHQYFHSPAKTASPAISGQTQIAVSKL